MYFLGGIALKKLLGFCEKIFTTSKWLVKVKLKSEKVITHWFTDKDQADEFVEWILDYGKGRTIQNIETDDCVIRLNRDEVETVSMKGYSLFQTEFIVPIKSFLKQETSLNISFNNAIAIFLICIIINFLVSYNLEVFLLQETEIFNFLNQEVFEPALISFKVLMIPVFILIISAGLIKLKKAINNYYSGLLIYSRGSIFETLLLIFSLPLIIKLILEVLFNICFSFQ